MANTKINIVIRKLNELELNQPNYDPHKILLHNMRVADSTHDLQLILIVSESWFNLNKGKTYYDHEMYFREHKMDTHLIANKKPIALKNTKLITPGTSITNPQNWMDYEVIFSCRPHPYAINEVLTHWPSLEANQHALKRAGALTMTPESDLDINNGPIVLPDASEIRKLSNVFLDDTSPMAALRSNKALLYFSRD